MTFTVKSLAAFSSTEPLKPYDLERRDLFEDDVLIDILYCGVCHSDLHLARNEWHNTHYPLVAGHEIVGKIAKVGDKVSKFKVGDIAGVGCLADSCRKCKSCENNHEMFCKHMALSLNSEEPRFPGHYTGGGFSQKIVVPEFFALKVPEKLQEKGELPGVAPLLCSGITTYSPLRQFDVKEGTKVAIAGFGGLGNIAVRLAKALGADVTVISRSHRKDEDAKRSGASGVIASGDPKEMEEAADQFDLILDTIPFDHDVNEYVPLLAPFGTLCIVGHLGTLQKYPVSTLPLIFGDRRIAGSAIGGIKETQELLDLCAENHIRPEYKLIEMEDLNKSMDALQKGETSSRYVIEVFKYK